MAGRVGHSRKKSTDAHLAGKSSSGKEKGLKFRLNWLRVGLARQLEEFGGKQAARIQS
jgi:hypothetical protein